MLLGLLCFSGCFSRLFFRVLFSALRHGMFTWVYTVGESQRTDRFAEKLCSFPAEFSFLSNSWCESLFFLERNTKIGSDMGDLFLVGCVVRLVRS